MLHASASPCLAETPAAPAAAEIRALKREAHPRILTTAQALRELKERATSNAEVAKMAAQLREQANALLKEAPSKYEIPDGKRLLATSRRVFERSLTLGLAFHLTGDRQ